MTAPVTFSQEITAPSGAALGDYASILRSDAENYSEHPLPYGVDAVTSYNSNSFVAGALQATGNAEAYNAIEANIAVAGSTVGGVWVPFAPGFDKPIPSKYYHFTGLGGTSVGGANTTHTGLNAPQGYSGPTNPFEPGATVSSTWRTNSGNSSMTEVDFTDGSSYYANTSGHDEAIVTKYGVATLGAGEGIGYTADGLNSVFASNAASLSQWSNDPNYDLDSWILKN